MKTDNLHKIAEWIEICIFCESKMLFHNNGFIYCLRCGNKWGENE